MNIFKYQDGDSEEQQAKKNAAKAQTEVGISFQNLVDAFDKACKSEELAHYRLYLRIHSDNEGNTMARVYNIGINTARISIINETVTFHWRPAAFIFIQNDGTRELCKKICDGGHLFGVSRGEWLENYKSYKKKIKDRANGEKKQ